MASFDEVVEQLLLEVQDSPEVASVPFDRIVHDGPPVPSYGFTPAGRQLVTAAPGKVCDRLPELWQLAFEMDDYFQGMHMNVTTEMLQVALDRTPELAELYARQDRFTHSSSEDQVEQVMWCVDNAPHLVLAAIEENPRTMAEYHTAAVLRLAPEVVAACWERLPADEIADIAARWPS